MKYVITGVNRLTRQREVISKPKKWFTAHEMLERWKILYENVRKPAYTSLRIEEAVENLSLF
jgi:hypothetical protein